LDEQLTPFESITNYNNYYEFSLDKEEVARLSENFATSPWEIEVGGLVEKPSVFNTTNLKNRYLQEERIYRLRCVEGWSMVIPWLGFPLALLLNDVQPLSDANYVRFTAIFNPTEMPGQKNKWYQWPYVEGLRIDEAMNNLTILATGLYGKDLLPQNGAPVRLVVPWKYGFKSIKSVVKIELVKEMPLSFWMMSAPKEYGFYSNVNPTVPHPRWSQTSERRIGEFRRRKTLMFNGYEDEVKSLYTGMDLKKFF
ncbi:MAG: protein-methionine-sulfoxide reductase catalytic subunit MsrP, partial [Candidatus Hodarchaeales archaeon]